MAKRRGRPRKNNRKRKVSSPVSSVDEAIRGAEERRMAEHFAPLTPKRTPVPKQSSGTGICPFCPNKEPGNATKSTAHFRVATLDATATCVHHCDLCPPEMVFWSGNFFDVLRHKKKEHPFRCETCHLLFVTEDEQSLHDYINHNQLHICKPCNRAYATLRGYRSHENTQKHRDSDAFLDLILGKLGVEKLVKKRVPWEALRVPDVVKDKEAFDEGCFVIHDFPAMKEFRQMWKKLKQRGRLLSTPAPNVADEDVAVPQLGWTPTQPNIYQASLEGLGSLSPKSLALTCQELGMDAEDGVDEPPPPQDLAPNHGAESWGSATLPPETACIPKADTTGWEFAEDVAPYHRSESWGSAALMAVAACIPNADVAGGEFAEDDYGQMYGSGTAPMCDFGYEDLAAVMSCF